MCRGKFKKSALKGFTLLELYETLDETKAINSTVVCEGEEDGDIAPAELYVNNPIVDGWNKIISRGGRIFWEDFYKLDIASRDTITVPEVPSVEAPVRGSLQAPVQPSLELPIPPSVQAPGQPSFQPAEVIMTAMEKGFQNLEIKIGDVSARLTDMSARLRDVEERVFKKNVVDGEAGNDFDFDNTWAGLSGEGDVGVGVGDNQGKAECDVGVGVGDNQGEAECDVGVGVGDNQGEAEGDVGDGEGEADVGEGEGKLGLGYVDQKMDEEDNAWALVVVDQFPQVANQFPVVEEVQDDEDQGEKVPAVRGRKRNPSKFCKTPYTRRSKRRKA